VTTVIEGMQSNAHKEVDGGAYEGAVYVKGVDKRQLQVLQGKDQVVQDLKAVDYYRT
jgi:hypothetical protein